MPKAIGDTTKNQTLGLSAHLATSWDNCGTHNNSLRQCLIGNWTCDLKSDTI